MATVAFEGTTRVYPSADRAAVDALDLEISDGEFLVLVGPSGCGKSTSLRMLAGLEEVDEGAVRIADRDVTHLAPKDRDIAMVFQNYALYPHMTVAENTGFALKLAGVPRWAIRWRVAEAARILDLGPYLDRRPRALSGGQRQRVAMGRAIVRSPQVFLMDEPLSNLDAKLRTSTRTQIAALQRKLGVTTVYVTHDQVEAMTMGDRVAVLRDGVLQQCATPQVLYRRPENVFVATFVGSPAMNTFPARVTSFGHAEAWGVRVPLSRQALAAVTEEGTDRLIAGIRPESLERAAGAEDGFAVTVRAVEQLGSDAYLHATLDQHDPQFGAAPVIVARTDPRDPPAPGWTVYLRMRPGEEHLFSVTTGRRLPQ